MSPAAARSTARFRPAFSERSTVRVYELAPASESRSASAASLSALRATSTKSWPASARTVAMAAPIPELAPVMNAIGRDILTRSVDEYKAFDR